LILSQIREEQGDNFDENPIPIRQNETAGVFVGKTIGFECILASVWKAADWFEDD
jgi:hypothetical protein